MRAILIFGVIVIGFLFGNNNGYCAKVESNNDNNKGYIFVGTGTLKGKTQIGTWLDPAFLKGDKGDKGDTGLNGLDGKDGLNGLDGKDGLNGLDGKDGLNGLDGLNGKDFDPTEALRIENESKDRDSILDTKVNNNVTAIQKQDKQLQDHNNRLNNLDNRVNDISKRVGKLEKTQVIAELGVRILDTKHLSVIPYLQQNFTRAKVSEVGVKCLIKIGKSYEEKLIEDTNIRVKALEKKMGNVPIITKVVDKKGKLLSIQIQENGLSVGGEF